MISRHVKSSFTLNPHSEAGHNMVGKNRYGMEDCVWNVMRNGPTFTIGVEPLT